MNKKIVIIGGGISGLSALHYLKQKYLERDDVDITLLEKNDYFGGTIRTLHENGALIETGPNGFLSSRKRILQLAKELNLDNALVQGNEQAKFRYILVNQRLKEVPTSPKGFLKSDILNPIDKLRILMEIFIPKNISKEESVYDFGKRRLGKAFADRLLDPMVAGIYGGDAKEIQLKAAFPRMYDLEKNYGSLFKAMRRLKKDGKSGSGMPKGELMSFKQGMGQLIEAFADMYGDHIKCSKEIKTISRNDQHYVLYSDDHHYEADEIYCAVPSYVASELLKGLDQDLSTHLKNIEYAPIAVVSMMYNRDDFKTLPKGFGFLVPSSENKEVLGILFDSNIFPQRAPDNQLLCRAMIGGARNPGSASKTEEELVHIASAEMKNLFNTAQSPEFHKVIFWPRAIPQYTKDYVERQKHIEERLKDYQNLHIVANYWKGIALTDCIENAYQAAAKSSV